MLTVSNVYNWCFFIYLFYKITTMADTLVYIFITI